MQTNAITKTIQDMTEDDFNETVKRTDPDMYAALKEVVTYFQTGSTWLSDGCLINTL